MKYKNIRNGLRRIGLDISPYPNGTLRRKAELLNLYNIDVILDVGASDGGFALQIRSIGFKGKIISFEPISESFLILKKKSQLDINWIALNIALGETNCEKEINISENYDSSSLLEMTDSHLIANPNTKYFTKEKVVVRKLDTIFKNYVSSENNVLLKLDVQGYEKKVLEGAKESLKYIKGIQLEMSLEELYKGSPLYDDMNKFIEAEGFTLCLLESGNRSLSTGKLLQVDGTFYKIMH